MPVQLLVQGEDLRAALTRVGEPLYYLEVSGVFVFFSDPRLDIQVEYRRPADVARFVMLRPLLATYCVDRYWDGPKRQPLTQLVM